MAPGMPSCCSSRFNAAASAGAASVRPRVRAAARLAEVGLHPLGLLAQLRQTLVRRGERRQPRGGRLQEERRAPRPPSRRTCAATPSGPTCVRGSLGGARGRPPGPRDSPGRHGPARRARWPGSAPARPALRDRIQPSRLGERVRGADAARRPSRSPPRALLGLRRPLEQPFDVREARLLDGQSFRFPVARVDRLDLVHLIGQQVELALSLARRSLERVERRARIAPPLPRLAIRRERDEMRIAGEPIEESRLRGRRQQTLRLVLPVDLDQRRHRARRASKRSRAAPDAGGALPVQRPPSGPGGPRRPPTTRRRPSMASNRAWTRAACAPVADERAVGSDHPTRAPGRPSPWSCRRPVSPVRTFRPGCSSRSRSSMTPSPLMCSSRSTARILSGVPTSPIVTRRHRSDRRAARTCPARARGTAAHRTRRTRRAGRSAAPMRARLPTGKLDALAAVGRQQAGFVTHHLEDDVLVRAQDERAVEDHVRGDRRQHQARRRPG